MSYARKAAAYINAFARMTFPADIDARMASDIANGSYIDCFDHDGGGSHKYIPADRLTRDLGEREGAGVFGYWHMKDGSYLLRTCHGALAYWSGVEGEAAEWGDFAK